MYNSSRFFGTLLCSVSSYRCARSVELDFARALNHQLMVTSTQSLIIAPSSRFNLFISIASSTRTASSTASSNASSTASSTRGAGDKDKDFLLGTMKTGGG